MVPTARCVYRISATLSIALFFGVWAFLFKRDTPEAIASLTRGFCLLLHWEQESHSSE